MLQGWFSIEGSLSFTQQNKGVTLVIPLLFRTVKRWHGSELN